MSLIVAYDMSKEAWYNRPWVAILMGGPISYRGEPVWFIFEIENGTSTFIAALPIAEIYETYDIDEEHQTWLYLKKK